MSVEGERVAGRTGRGESHRNSSSASATAQYREESSVTSWTENEFKDSGSPWIISTLPALACNDNYNVLLVMVQEDEAQSGLLF